MYAVNVQYVWASVRRSDCVFVIVVLEWRPLENVRERQLINVTEHHCHSAEGLQVKSPLSPTSHTLMYYFPKLPRTLGHTHPVKTHHPGHLCVPSAGSQPVFLI